MSVFHFGLAWILLALEWTCCVFVSPDERFVQGAAGIRALDWLTAGRLTKLQQHFKDRASKLHLHRKHSFADSSNSMSAPEFVSHCVDLVGGK